MIWRLVEMETFREYWDRVSLSVQGTVIWNPSYSLDMPILRPPFSQFRPSPKGCALLVASLFFRFARNALGQDALRVSVRLVNVPFSAPDAPGALVANL